MKWTSSQENLSSGFLTKRVSNQSPQLQGLARKLKFHLQVASLDMTLSKKGKTKALMSLHGCAGWSVPLLFTNHRRQVFSRRGPNNTWSSGLTENQKFIWSINNVLIRTYALIRLNVVTALFSSTGLFSKSITPVII